MMAHVKVTTFLSLNGKAQEAISFYQKNLMQRFGSKSLILKSKQKWIRNIHFLNQKKILFRIRC